MLSAMFSGRHELRQLSDGAYFIDRDPKYFRYILNYLRYGTVSWPENDTTKKLIKLEFDYYAIDYEGRGIQYGGSGEIHDFKYISDFDKKGYLYHIATDGGNSSWMNPRLRGLVDLEVSEGFYRIIGQSAERYNNEEDKNLAFEYETDSDQCLCSPSGSGNWMVIDLKGKKLRLTGITMACSYCPDTYLPNCTFSGCNDKLNWENIEILSTTSIGDSKTRSWRVVMDDFVRYIRINQQNSYQVLISGLELYGDVV